MVTPKRISKTWLQQQESFLGVAANKATPEHLAALQEYLEAKEASDAYEAVAKGAKRLGWYPNDYDGKNKAGATVPAGQGFTAVTETGRKFMTFDQMANWLERRKA